MANETPIEWADRTCNPFTGCTQISAGCENCYARTQAKWLQGLGNPRYKNGFEFTYHPEALDEITPGQKPAVIFMCSMSDMFHRQAQSWQIAEIFRSMDKCPQHRFMILTKRHITMREHSEWFPGLQFMPAWPLPNVALGVTGENQECLRKRLYDLKRAPAAYRFLSLEPLLGPIDLFAADPEWHTYIDLVIVGGESGPKARPVHPEWVRSIREQCAGAGVPFCFKQWGEWAPECLCRLPATRTRACSIVHNRRTARPEPGPAGFMHRCGKKAAGRLLDGVLHDDSINWRI